MAKITSREFDIRQPYFPEHSDTDSFYLELSNRLLKIIEESNYGAQLHDELKKRLALILIGYYQDIISDTGLWRSFTDANYKLYGRRVPFHTVDDDYIKYELNKEDIRFLTWYTISMLDLDRRRTSPDNREMLELADLLYDRLNQEYEDAPVPEKYNIVRGLSFHDPEDTEAIYHLGHWLFYSSWLLTPAFALTLSVISSDPAVKSDKEGLELNKRLEESMFELPTGPLALYTQEWLNLLLTGNLVELRGQDPENTSSEVHPYYSKFVKATGGREIAFFQNYEELNTFFIEALGWAAGERHLSQLAKDRYFVLLVNPKKGMLLAKNVAQCIADSSNPYYDKEYATEHAFDLMTIRGVSPHDLNEYLFKHQYLPDAHFPGSDSMNLVKDNQDFICRCYLQQYYRGD